MNGRQFLDEIERSINEEEMQGNGKGKQCKAGERQKDK